MLPFLLTLIASAHADTNVCSLRNLAIDQSLLTQYAAGSVGLKAPKLFRTEENPEFAPDFPTTYWALPTAGTTVEVKVHRAAPVATKPHGPIQIGWSDTVLTIDPVTRTVSGADDCDVLHPVTEHVLEILKVIQEPDAPH